ncbi:MAG: hypothetical protein H0V51_22170 [Chloroflexi bacterium]|nr:hypothetical protein [Chloroflexota bacterium]
MALHQTDLRAILDLIVLGAVQMLRGSAGAVALWDEAEARLAVGAGYGLDERTLGSLHPRLDQVILDHLGRVGETVSVFPVPPDGAGMADDIPTQILALPLTVAGRGPVGAEDVEAPGSASRFPHPAEGGQVPPVPARGPDLVGVIYVFREPSAARFEASDLELLDLFARQARTAIEQARLAAATAAEKDRLETMQSSFISIVSHELQTPVAIIKAYAGTLARPDAPWSRETVTRVAHTIEEECDRLHRLITDLLDLSRIQAGRVAMSMGPVDLADLAETVAARSRPHAPGHTISADFPPDFPIVRGDREKLGVALGNLLDNAIKYSPGGEPVVVGGRAEPGFVVMTVHDEGVGVPSDERDRIFDRFHRVDTGLSRTTKGVGLGLYICKVIVEAHGGRIWVESPGSDHGSTFSLRLPR